MSRKLVTCIILAIVVVFIGSIAYKLVTYKQPIFFPLDNPQGEYKITKKCPNGQGWEENIKVEDSAYCLEYKGNNVFNSKNGSSSFFRITIGNSNVDLSQHLNQQVKNIKGDFVRSSKQCILNNCVDIGGSHVVLDVNSFEVKK